MFHQSHSSSQRKVIIVDWDDTILPSTYIDKWQIENVRDLPLHFQNLLTDLGRCAEKFLEEASKYGEVVIITNSDEGWVQYSAEKYCPYLVSVMERYRVVSARTGYEQFYPGQTLCWKAAAFAHEVNEIFSSVVTNSTEHVSKVEDDDCASMVGTDVSSTSSDEEEEDEAADSSGDSMDTTTAADHCDGDREIISFGDSMEERTAVRIVSKQLEATSKSVMFINAPTPVQIMGQLHMLTNHMQFVCENSNSLDLEISKDQADEAAGSYMKSHNLPYDHNVVPSYAQKIPVSFSEDSSNDYLLSNEI